MADNGHDHEHEVRQQDRPLQLSPVEGPGRPQRETAGGRALADALKVSFRFLKLAMIVLVVVWLATGVFVVHTGEVKFKLRFGRVVSSGGEYVLQPGKVRLRWPWEEVVTVQTDEKTLALDKAFWPAVVNPNVESGLAKLSVRSDGYLISGDANIVHMKLQVRYRASEDADGATAYRFFVENPEEILRRAFEASTTKVVGSTPVMDVINPRGLFENIALELQARLDAFERENHVPIGIKIVRVEAISQEREKNPSEPAAVRRAFTDAQDAASNRNKLIQEGKTEADRILTDAKAKQAESLAATRGYAARLVRAARADATELSQLLPVYENSPEQASILREDFYQRAVMEVLANAPGAFVLREPPAGTNSEIRVMLSKPAAAQKQLSAPTAGAPGAPPPR